MADTPAAAEHPPATVETARPEAGEDAAAHHVDGGPRLQLGPDGERIYSINCSCGWTSEPCRTAVMAEAHGEQHVTFARGRSRVRRRPA